MAFDGRVLEFIVVVPARLVGGVKAGSLVGADVKVAISKIKSDKHDIGYNSDKLEYYKTGCNKNK